MQVCSISEEQNSGQQLVTWIPPGEAHACQEYSPTGARNWQVSQSQLFRRRH